MRDQVRAMSRTVISLPASEVGRRPVFPRSNIWSKRRYGRRGYGLAEEKCIRPAQAIGIQATCSGSKERRRFASKQPPFPDFSARGTASLHALFRGGCAPPRGTFRPAAERRQSSDRDPREARNRLCDCTGRRHRRKRVCIGRSSSISVATSIAWADQIQIPFRFCSSCRSSRFPEYSPVAHKRFCSQRLWFATFCAIR